MIALPENQSAAYIPRMDAKPLRPPDHPIVGADSERAPSFVLPADLILAQIHDAVVAIDPEGRVTYWGNGAVKLYQVAGDEALGRPLTQLCEHRWSSPDQEREAHAAVQHQGHWHGRNIHVLRSGEQRHVDSSVTALRDGEGNPVGSLAVIRDVTDLYDSMWVPQGGADGRAERRVEHVLGLARDVPPDVETTAELERLTKEIWESRARSAYAVALSGVGFWYCDLPFDELMWDSRCKSHFFVPPGARVTIDMFYGRIVPDDRAHTRVAIEASIRDRTTYDVVYRTRDPESGAVKWIRAMGGTSYAPDGTPTRFDGVTVDISAQKRDEERIASTVAQLEEASRVKDEFLAMLGHELRNPLAPIATAVHLLKLRSKDSVPRELSVIERQSQHLTRLVDDLLDVARIAGGKVILHKKKVDVAELVAAAIETASPLIEQKGHALVLELAEQTPVVDVDRMRMTQVLSNLLANAAKYTPAGGRICVTASREGDNVVIVVEDTGMGISSELLPSVFDLFVQSRQTLNRAQGGLGLGLSIVKNLVDLHGGSVSAYSDGLGFGSVFTVRLPAVQAPATNVGGSSPLLAGATNERHHFVLVVDDNADGADLLAEALGLLGYRTAVAHDGPEALRIARESLPDVALLDIGLPVMNGYELASILREQSLAVKLVALTGYGQESDLQRSRESGFQAHLTKPVDLNELASLLRKLTAGNEDAGPPVHRP